MNDTATLLPIEFSDQPLVMSVLMTPSHVNFGGRAHGGYLLKLLDEAAYICSAHHCGGYAVTASLNQANFMGSIDIGDMVHIHASIDLTGRSSMEISLNVVAENPRTQKKRYVHQAFITMVAVDDAYKPIAVKPIELQTAPAKKRYEMAKIRRELLQAYKTRAAEIAL